MGAAAGTVAQHALRIALALAFAGVAASAVAQVRAENPWVRATVPGQMATGGFVELTSTRDATLVKVESPVAATVEVHGSEMKNGVMTMRAAPNLPLPAGKQVKLAPGGFHIMLMDLKQAVNTGDSVPLKLTFEYPDKTREVVEISAPARALGATGGAVPAAAEHQHKH